MTNLGDDMKCSDCGDTIPSERLQALPETTKCVKCAAINPDPPPFDPNDVCAKSSESGRNGFARSD